MEAIAQYKTIRGTKPGKLVIGVVQLGISYGLTSWAINNGNLICWIAAVAFFVWGVKNLLKLIGSLIYGKRFH